MNDRRRKWDQPGDDDGTKKAEEGSKSAEAAAAAVRTRFRSRMKLYSRTGTGSDRSQNRCAIRESRVRKLCLTWPKRPS